MYWNFRALKTLLKSSMFRFCRNSRRMFSNCACVTPSIKLGRLAARQTFKHSSEGERLSAGCLTPDIVREVNFEGNVRAGLSICLPMHTHSHIHIQIHSLSLSLTHKHTHTHTESHTVTHTHTNIHTQTYTVTHTHKHLHMLLMKRELTHHEMNCMTMICVTVNY